MPSQTDRGPIAWQRALTVDRGPSKLAEDGLEGPLKSTEGPLKQI